MATKKATSIWVVTSEGKAINKMQTEFNKTTSVLKDQAAILAASCALHMLEHGQATAMTRFAREAIAHGIIRSDAIVKWAVGLGMFTHAKEIVKDAVTGKEEKIDVFKKDKEGFEAALAEYNKDKDAYAKNLVNNPFYLVVKARNPFEGFNFMRSMYALLDQAARIQDDAEKAGHSENNFTGLEDIKAVAYKFQRPEKRKRKAKAEATVPEAVIVH